MNNSLCIGSRGSNIKDGRSILRGKCRAIALLTCLNGSLAGWGIATQVNQLSPEKEREKTLSGEALIFISPPGPERININRASEQELQSLPGIGVVTAKRIVDYRKKNPAFRKVEELLIIRGISKNRLEKIRSMISVH